jgi:hypothetical protein
LNPRSDFTTAQKDTTIDVAERHAQLEIGPLRANIGGTKATGLVTKARYDVTHAWVQARVVQGPSAATVIGALSVGVNAGYYTWRLVGTSLKAQKVIDGTTTTVKTVAFTAAHAYLRIKHDQATNQVVFETAGADANGWPVSWTEQKRLAWDAAVPLVDVQVELKAATTGATANPGLVTFDNVEITRY